MALNKKSFQTRALTAIVFAVIMLLGLFWNPWSFFVLFTIVHFGCWWEYLTLIEKIHRISLHLYVKLGLMVMGFGMLLWFCDFLGIGRYGFRENFSMPVSAAGFAVLIAGIFQKNLLPVKAFLVALGGLAYISMSWGLMLDLYIIETAGKNISSAETMGEFKGEPFPLFMLGLIPIIIVFTMWVNDTMAYIVGSFIGKTPFSPISPKKTWEGTIGGIILAVAVISLSVIFIYKHAGELPWHHWVVIPAIAAIFGTVGDLFESKLKRLASVKDSGTLMPGHGGFLDRFDSLLLATPFVWLYVTLSLKHFSLIT